MSASLAPVPGRIPMANLDAEAAVLSACCLSIEACDETMAILRPIDFYADANRRIFEAIIELITEGTPVDLVSVSAVLRNKGRLDQIGGTSYLAQIIDATPFISNVGTHARLVLDCARVRRACATFQRLAAEAYGEIPDVQEWLQAAEAAVYEAAIDHSEQKQTASTYKEIAKKAYKTVVDAAKTKAESVGYCTGFSELDEHVGGLVGGDLLFVAGRPGQGKTSWAIQVGENVAGKYDVGVIVLSAEMDRVPLMQRTFARVAAIPGRNLKLGRLMPDQWTTLSREAQATGNLPIMVDDDRNLTPMRVRSKVRRRLAELRQAYNKPDLKLGLVVIDYVQLMAGDNRNENRRDTRATELGEISRALKIMAGEFGCAFMVLSQLKRVDKSAKDKRPELDSLRDSGALEADADVVIAIHREDAYAKPGEQKDGLAELLVLKGRNSGESCHVVEFDGRYTAFYRRGSAPAADHHIEQPPELYP